MKITSESFFRPVTGVDMLKRRFAIYFLILVGSWFLGVPESQTIGQVVVTSGSDLEEQFSGTLYEMTITPATEPNPAFKYRFITPPHKTIPGNAVTHYLRSFGERSLSGPWKVAESDFGFDEVHRWYDLETPVSKIQIENLKTASARFDQYINMHIRRATKCRDADWGLAMEDLSGKEMIKLLLPSVQQTRQIGRALMLRNRLAVIEGRHQDSVENIGMLYKLGDSVNEMGMLVCNLVGAAEVGMASECVKDLISSPDAPNLYWALAELPRPILNFRRALRLESNWPQRFFPELDDVETAQYSDQEWKRRLVETIDIVTDVKELNQYTGYLEKPARSEIQSQLIGAGFGLAGYGSAKKRLLDSGMDADRVKAMSVAQVLLIDFKRDCEYYANEVEKTMYVPYAHSVEFNNRAENHIRLSPTRFGAVFVGTISPALQQVQFVEKRIQADVDSLMVIEAIRNHVALHKGFPKSLNDLELPIRNNLMTGKPFGYQLENGSAVLNVEMGSLTRRYVISIAKQGSEASSK